MRHFPKAAGVEALARETPLSLSPFPDYALETLSHITAFHQSLPQYRPTPLCKLDHLAHRLALGNLYVKDESHRFGLNAYKGLGGIYAVARVVCRELGLDIRKTTLDDLKHPRNLDRIREMTLVTATDGNHGNGVAWSASQLDCRSFVYMPKGSSEHRAERIRRSGATEVTITGLLYDDAVRFAAKQAGEHGWFLVQDTAWEGYTEIPTWIGQGYTTLAVEIYNQLEEINAPLPTHLFLQAGVGSMAGAIAAYLYNRLGNQCPKIAIMEPDTIACIYRSAKVGNGAPHSITEGSSTIMAGLNCGEPSITAWPILRDLPAHYIACDDFVAARGMRFLGHPLGNDPQIISGESGAIGAGLISLLMEKPELESLRHSLDLSKDSALLLINTEGNTDPDMYDRIVFDGFCPSF